MSEPAATAQYDPTRRAVGVFFDPAQCTLASFDRELVPERELPERDLPPLEDGQEVRA